MALESTQMMSFFIVENLSTRPLGSNSPQRGEKSGFVDNNSILRFIGETPGVSGVGLLLNFLFTPEVAIPYSCSVNADRPSPFLVFVMEYMYTVS